ncbi:hypothetical protein B0H14DRAFT_2645570 [Mycena olivaceomarginata]|nr:hypothetical protein B0H14DRAFT_2645570 [Mycena olivaceomarginata]
MAPKAIVLNKFGNGWKFSITCLPIYCQGANGQRNLAALHEHIKKHHLEDPRILVSNYNKPRGTWLVIWLPLDYIDYCLQTAGVSSENKWRDVVKKILNLPAQMKCMLVLTHPGSSDHLLVREVGDWDLRLDAMGYYNLLMRDWSARLPSVPVMGTAVDHSPTKVHVHSYAGTFPEFPQFSHVWKFVELAHFSGVYFLTYQEIFQVEGVMGLMGELGEFSGSFNSRNDVVDGGSRRSENVKARFTIKYVPNRHSPGWNKIRNGRVGDVYHPGNVQCVGRVSRVTNEHSPLPRAMARGCPAFWEIPKGARLV